MLTKEDLQKRAVEDVSKNISLNDGIKELKRFLHDGGFEYKRVNITFYSRAYCREATRLALDTELDWGIKENIMLGFMEEVPGKQGHYRLTPAGEDHVKKMAERNHGSPDR